MSVTSIAPAGRLEGKVILITGASRGVGAACAVACAAEGAMVALSAKTVDKHHTLPGSLNETAAAVRAAGGEALVVPCDVRFEEQVQAMIEATVAHFGRLDAVVNNAGAIFLQPVGSFPPKKFDLVMGVNVRAAYLVSHFALPHLRKQGGHVLMMSPPVNPAAAPGKAPYLVSKVGMTIVAQGIDAEEDNVSACALWPVTAIKTAATIVFGLGEEKDWREVEILSDATVQLLARDPKTSSFKAWLDEEVLAQAGISDFAPYRCLPDCEPDPWSIQMVDPSWSRD